MDATATHAVCDIPGAARYLGISERLCRQLVREGSVAHSRIGHGGKLIRITTTDLDAYIASARVESQR